MEETYNARWITNFLHSITLTSNISQKEGDISLTLSSLDQHIEVIKNYEQIEIDV